MKRVMIIMTAAGLAAGWAAAAVPEGEAALAAASEKMLAKDAEGALAAYDAAAKAHPEIAPAACRKKALCLVAMGRTGEGIAEYLSVAARWPAETNDAVRALAYLGPVYAAAGMRAEGLGVFDRIAAEYPALTEEQAGVVALWRGRTLAALGDNAGALKAFEAAVARFSACPSMPPGARVGVMRTVACLRERAGDAAGAQALRREIVLAGVAALGAKEARGAVQEAFDRIDPSAMTADRYREFLKEAILRTPAVEDNAKFLGRLKSELEKIRE